MPTQQSQYNTYAHVHPANMQRTHCNTHMHHIHDICMHTNTNTCAHMTKHHTINTYTLTPHTQHTQAAGTQALHIVPQTTRMHSIYLIPTQQCSHSVQYLHYTHLHKHTDTMHPRMCVCTTQTHTVTHTRPCGPPCLRRCFSFVK